MGRTGFFFEWWTTSDTGKSDAFRDERSRSSPKSGKFSVCIVVFFLVDKCARACSFIENYLLQRFRSLHAATSRHLRMTTVIVSLEGV